MKFALDDDGRFQLSSREGGWDLVVDDVLVHYCLSPVEAITYMSETLIDEIDVAGVGAVVEALAGIRAAAESAADVSRANAVATMLAPAIAAVTRPVHDTRRQCLMTASMTMGRCTEAELRVRDDGKHVVARARAVLEPCFSAWGMSS